MVLVLAEGLRGRGSAEEALLLPLHAPDLLLLLVVLLLLPLMLLLLLATLLLLQMRMLLPMQTKIPIRARFLQACVQHPPLRAWLRLLVLLRLHRCISTGRRRVNWRRL